VRRAGGTWESGSRDRESWAGQYRRGQAVVLQEEVDPGVVQVGWVCGRWQRGVLRWSVRESGG